MGSGVDQFPWSSATAGRVDTHRFSNPRLPVRPLERIISRPSRRIAVRVSRTGELSALTGTPGPQVLGVLHGEVFGARADVDVEEEVVLSAGGRRRLLRIIEETSTCCRVF